MTRPANGTRIILASSSSYRKELLSRLQLPFEIMVPDIDESAWPDETPQATALRLAQHKAQCIADLVGAAIIIGSDQVATLNGVQLGKPGNHERALAQLQMMRGQQVTFHTALCVIHNVLPTPVIALENILTRVTMRNLPDAELDAYLRIEQPYDCAGSAKNEGLGIAIIDSIDSTDPTALTGLPLIALTGMLRQLGVQFFTGVSQVKLS